ncbi:hypothetical protein [Martelella soudanensis]|uniref:hypothetical protein n=1 Tax=unclassified Martelella TaxID=2629616 RepID=UPI0015DE878E|nr:MULTISPECIES: hypothetical protein [unclassified Martelella]
MSNPVKGTVTHEIDGETVELMLGMNEWCELEEELGMETTAILRRFQAMADEEKIDMKFFRVLFRGMLSSASPEVTHKDAGRIAATMGLINAFRLLGEVIMASIPSDAEGDDKQPKKQNRATRRKAAATGGATG